MSQLKKKIVSFTVSKAQEFEHFPFIFISVFSYFSFTSNSTYKSDACDQAKKAEK